MSGALSAYVSVRHPGDPPYFGDQWFYLRLAREWRAGDGLTTSAEISAGYPLFVALVDLARSTSWLRPDLVVSVGLVQSALSGLTVLLTGVLGRRVAGPAAGLAAAAVLAFWPNVVIGAAVVLSEPLATLLGVAVVLALVWERQPSTTRLLVAGALLGLAAEVRPGSLVLLALFLAVPAGGPWLRRLRSLALGGVAVLLVVLPFALRSSYVARSFVPFDLRAGSSLCLGRLPEADGGPIDFERCPYTQDASAVEANRERLDRAFQLLRENPGREPRLMVGRMEATLWDSDRSGIDQLNSRDGRDLDQRLSNRLAGLSTVWSRVVVVLAVVGTALALLRRRRGLTMVVLAGWSLLAIPLISLGDARFRLPSLPFLAIAAASLLSARRRPSAVPDPLSPSEGSVGSLH
ncbi:MAG: glycosyltransferase family 39 protein [Acidimicrobiales bacterium]|nr:glycosyltransferase family 39 protein [Acidimicrobiales bacterium]